MNKRIVAKKMVIEKPYHLEIADKWQAYNAIANMCSNCPQLRSCTASDYCDALKDRIRIHFMSLN